MTFDPADKLAQIPLLRICTRGDAVEAWGSGSANLGHRISPRDGNLPDGVFAEWVWDGTTLMARGDRYGFHPLFYYATHHEVMLSPSIPRLLQAGAPSSLDFPALAVFLQLGFFVGEDTPFEAIRATPPGGFLRWAPGRFDVSGEPCVRYDELRISRRDAITEFLRLFAKAIERRIGAGGPKALPLSGGRDSRHILFELCKQGAPPDFCVTANDLPPVSSRESAVAAQIARELGIKHVILDQPRSLLDSETRKNLLTSLCADEHRWFLVVADYLASRARTVYDGIGGDVLSGALFCTPELVSIFRERDPTTIASSLIAHVGRRRELPLPLLSRQFQTRVGADVAIHRLAREVRKHRDAVNPSGSFFFWNRTRREIALAPYAMLRDVDTVFAPYIDHDLFDFLGSLPVDILISRTLHEEAISKGYPKHAHLPYERKDARSKGEEAAARRFGRELAMRLAARPGCQLLDKSFVWPRLLRSFVDPFYAPWICGQASFLMQLDELCAPLA